jgi:hypothetical protein
MEERLPAPHNCLHVDSLLPNCIRNAEHITRTASEIERPEQIDTSSPSPVGAYLIRGLVKANPDKWGIGWR